MCLLSSSYFILNIFWVDKVNIYIYKLFPLWLWSLLTLELNFIVGTTLFWYCLLLRSPPTLCTFNQTMMSKLTTALLLVTFANLCLSLHPISMHLQEQFEQMNVNTEKAKCSIMLASNLPTSIDTKALMEDLPFTAGSIWTNLKDNETSSYNYLNIGPVSNCFLLLSFAESKKEFEEHQNRFFKVGSHEKVATFIVKNGNQIKDWNICKYQAHQTIFLNENFEEIGKNKTLALHGNFSEWIIRNGENHSYLYFIMIVQVWPNLTHLSYAVKTLRIIEFV